MEFENPLKGKSRTVQILVVIGIALLLIAAVYAVVTWNQSVSWTVQSISFTVDKLTTLDLGTVPVGNVTTEVFTIHNTGNVPITVSASNMFTGATVGWDKTSALIAVNATATFTATITITGTGSGTITFTG